jgi:hypothetical protein
MQEQSCIRQARRTAADSTRCHAGAQNRKTPIRRISCAHGFAFVCATGFNSPTQVHALALRCGAVRCGATAKNLPTCPACCAQYPTVTPPAIQVFNISVDSLAAPAAAHGRPCATARKALRAAVRADKLTLLDDTLAATRTSDRSGAPWAERCALHVASGFIHDVPCHASRTRDRLQRL